MSTIQLDCYSPTVSAQLIALEGALQPKVEKSTKRGVFFPEGYLSGGQKINFHIFSPKTPKTTLRCVRKHACVLITLSNTGQRGQPRHSIAFGQALQPKV